MSDVGPLLSGLRRQGVDLWLDGGRLRYMAPTGVLTPETIAELQLHRSEVAGFLGRSSPSPPALVPVTAGRPAPLAIAQESCWMLEEFLPGSSLAKVFAVWRLTGPLDRHALEQTFDEIARRHETLRTTFTPVEGSPAQIVAADPLHALSLEDLRGLSRDERVEASIRCIARQTSEPFDLAHGPLIRLALLTTGPDESLLLLTLHHMICDPWSLEILAEEVATIYAALVGEAPPPLPPLAVQYGDFAVWQRSLVAEGAFDSQVSYWKWRLDGGNLPDVGIPADHPRPAEPSFETSQEMLTLSESVSTGLAERSQAEGATLFITLVTALKLMIQHLSGESHVHLATLVAARRHPELARMIGLFSNTVVLRTELGGAPTFRAALQRVRETVLDAYEYQDLPFEGLLTELERGQNLQRESLSRVLFLFTNRTSASRRMGEVTLRPVDVGKGLLEAAVDLNTVTSFDLIVNLTDRPGGISGSVVYKQALYSPATITDALAVFSSVAESLAFEPDARPSELRVSSPRQP